MSVPSESTTDVVIVGAGPSGLMAALWMAKCGVKARIIDAGATKIFRGHADAMQAGTLDIFDSFGMADELYTCSATTTEMSFWAGFGDSPVKRVARFPKWTPDIGGHCLIHTSQGNVERVMLDAMKAANGLEVERGVTAAALDIDESKVNDPQAYAVKLTVQHLTEEEVATAYNTVTNPVPQPGDFNYNPADEPYRVRKISGKEGRTEIIHAKFVIGADGGRSWTRDALGFEFVGDDEGNEHIAGIADVVATSDFPDMRTFSGIVKDGRACGFLGREDGITRITAPVASRAEASAENIIKTFQSMIAPYYFNVTKIDWCGIFGSRRRIASSSSKYSRAFLVGDALHVHSPRAGIGMNFSMADSYNLGWKLAHVIKGISPLSVLKTYDEERGLTTQQLIVLDKALSVAQNMAKFDIQATRRATEAGLPFTSCVAIEYEAGLLVAKGSGSVVSKQHLAIGIPVGQRLPLHTVEKHATGESLNFGKCFASNGLYRVVIFAGDISKEEQLHRVEEVSRLLELPLDAFEILVLHSASRDAVEIRDLPASLFTNRDPFSQVYVDNNDIRTWALGDAYNKYGVSKERGCLVLVRPDRHVMYVGELEDVTELVKLIENVLVY